ncbi:unnamed protein product [Chrysoparadoxa australica]
MRVVSLHSLAAALMQLFPFQRRGGNLTPSEGAASTSPQRYAMREPQRGDLLCVKVCCICKEIRTIAPRNPSSAVICQCKRGKGAPKEDEQLIRHWLHLIAIQCGRGSCGKASGALGRNRSSMEII